MDELNTIEVLQKDLSIISDRSSQIRKITEYLLDNLKATSAPKSKSANEIYEQYLFLRNNYGFIPKITPGTFSVLLSKIASETTTKINCLGTRQGYYLEQLVEKIENIEESKQISPDELRSDLIRERTLYPILKEWLFEKEYDRVGDISSLRSNGKWGNPDLVALKIEEIYGMPEIEITTVEIKLLDENWEQWIFEAVAHTRFSNRSYFSFIYPKNLFNKLDSTDLKLYAEHFRIGILIIEVEGNDYLKIKKKQPFDLKKEEIRIIEYCQAPYNQTHIKFRKKFLEALDLLELKKLYKFGEELE